MGQRAKVLRGIAEEGTGRVYRMSEAAFRLVFAVGLPAFRRSNLPALSRALRLRFEGFKFLICLLSLCDCCDVFEGLVPAFELSAVGGGFCGFVIDEGQFGLAVAGLRRRLCRERFRLPHVVCHSARARLWFRLRRQSTWRENFRRG